MLGKFTFAELREEPILGPILFLLFVFFVFFITVNFFVALVTEGKTYSTSDINTFTECGFIKIEIF